MFRNLHTGCEQYSSPEDVEPGSNCCNAINDELTDFQNCYRWIPTQFDQINSDLTRASQLCGFSESAPNPSPPAPDPEPPAPNPSLSVPTQQRVIDLYGIEEAYERSCNQFYNRVTESCDQYSRPEDIEPGSDCCNAINDGLTNYQNCNHWTPDMFNQIFPLITQASQCL